MNNIISDYKGICLMINQILINKIDNLIIHPNLFSLPLSPPQTMIQHNLLQHQLYWLHHFVLSEHALFVTLPRNNLKGEYK